VNEILPVTEAHTFVERDFISGDPVLDFVNTVTGRNARPRDWLADEAALRQWSAAGPWICEAVPVEETTPAHSVMDDGRDLREALHAIFKAIADGTPVPAPALATLETFWKAAAQRGRLSADAATISVATGKSPHALVDELALRAVELLKHDLSAILRVCSGPNCGWLFLDRSKAHRRRWCDMRTCGNDAKARTFRARNR
jgi:predicted RNA-binding Zn ribbon-like protein